ncbi:MAG TPA: hypothetical protein VHY91_13070 [Pirellulales bacterium]|jgi:hypothetical protein|nr:hypothetical protein [Pirellulales bacterium]
MTARRFAKIAACRLPLAVWLAFVSTGTAARGDGGAVVLSGRAGDYQIAVLASPAPPHVGPADLSVLVQDAATGQPVDGLSVTLRLVPDGGLPDEGLRLEATRAAATNKLFYAAQFDLPSAGRWTLTATAAKQRPGETAEPRPAAMIAGPLDVGGPPPRWVELWPWIGWPAIVVALFALREKLVCGRRERAGRPATIGAGRAG